ncbi:hypothetical protein EVJ58_g2976 [Rhodofomes roseus]|uniref:Uncharacterized protein n=1 Tax=Rhodofomes roseus TaxID=34475 RepID=A0A4Y9YQC7_9APHY|nr:hypothetical protein EVJ58_g2976 [Rhodofomes roseus]
MLETILTRDILSAILKELALLAFDKLVIQSFTFTTFLTAIVVVTMVLCVLFIFPLTALQVVRKILGLVAHVVIFAQINAIRIPLSVPRRVRPVGISELFETRLERHPGV